MTLFVVYVKIVKVRNDEKVRLKDACFLKRGNFWLYCGREPVAGETRFEHATYGFGDRYSTVEPLP